MSYKYDVLGRGLYHGVGVHHEQDTKIIAGNMVDKTTEIGRRELRMQNKNGR